MSEVPPFDGIETMKKSKIKSTVGPLTQIGAFGNYMMGLYPSFIVSFLFISGLLNGTPQGVIYLGGIIITVLLCVAVGSLIYKYYNNEKTNTQCYDLVYGWMGPRAPSYPTAICFFTMLYLGIPMHFNSATNWITTIFLIIGTLSNISFLYSKGCFDSVGISTGIVLGAFIGIPYTLLILYSYPQGLFYNELISNNVVCNRPSQTKFKCHVFKNGELISSNET
jgi:hypothetical protein